MTVFDNIIRFMLVKSKLKVRKQRALLRSLSMREKTINAPAGGGNEL